MIVLVLTHDYPRFKILLFWEMLFFLIGVPLKWLLMASSESQTLTCKPVCLKRVVTAIKQEPELRCLIWELRASAGKSNELRLNSSFPPLY